MSLPTPNLAAVAAVQAYLRQRTPNYETAYEMLTEPVVIVSLDRYIAYVNSSFCALFGYSAADLIGQHAELLYVSETEFTQATADYFDGTAGSSAKLLMVAYQKRDGTIFYGSSAPNALYEGDTIVGYLGIVRDISEAMQTRRELALTSFQLRSVFDSVPRALFFTAIDRTMIMVNPATERLFGYTKAELIGHTTRMLVADTETFEKLGQQRVNAQMPGIQLPFIQEFRKKSGELFLGEAIIGPIRDDDNTVIGFVGIVADVSNQTTRVADLEDLNLRLEQSVIERTAALETSNAELRAFAYSISHDLGAPLRAIRNYAEFIKQDNVGRLDAETLEFLQHIDDNAAYIDRLTQDLLQYSRIGRKVLELEEIELKPFLSGLVDRLSLDTQATIRIADNLPSISADYALLEQIFSNLLTNAVMYVAEDRKPVVQITCQADQTHWHFIVRDNGIGIAAQHLSRVFGIFERLHLQSEYPGTGIGLAVVKRAAEYMGGCASVSSTVGVGSMFRVSISKALENTND